MIVRRLDTIKRWDRQDLGGRRPSPSVVIVRYGGFGDLIQASSVFPWLKENGYYVTVNTTPSGYKIIQNDPHADEVFLQETSQVPNKDLGPYWDKLGGCFDRLIQFSESVEGSLLAVPGRKEYDLPDKERHLKMNVDYFAQMHKIAGVPMPPRPGFYPSKREAAWAEAYRKKLGLGNFVVMWTLSGSSVHKAWPYTDQVIARMLLQYPNIRIVFTGDGLCQLLEEAWRKEKRIVRASNRWTIRQTLTMAQHCDAVVGPETGVLNAVSHETNVPKIIMLSHSSPANLGGNWPNTTVLMPYGVDCYPCHKLHYGWKTCRRDEVTGGSACAAAITPDRVFDALAVLIDQKKRKAA